MRVTIKKPLAKLIDISELEQFGVDKDELSYRDEISINLAETTMEKTENLRKIMQKVNDKRKTATILKDINTWIEIRQKKSTKIRKLEIFNTALITYLMPVEGHRIYTKYHLDDDLWLCYRVTSVRYTPATPMHPAEVRMSLVFTCFGEDVQTSLDFYSKDVIGKKVPEILAEKGIYVETPDLREKYLKTHKRFHEVFPNIGKQYIANGYGTDQVLDSLDEEDFHSRYTATKFHFDDNKVVVDVFREKTDRDEYRRDREVDKGELFWKNPLKHTNKNEYDDLEEDEEVKGDIEITEEPVIEVPTHPFLTVFDLQRHLRLRTHVNYVKEYKYDKTLSEKLILNEENKDLIKILIEHKEGGFKDIVQNKTGGAIILLTGKAGVGKTLTAEVFAESKEKPLYSVQSSQLGIETKHLEKNLMKILERTARWNAILLIDEADVYVHERGNNINQNAIVGVILRILEYHSSILFMTTNRPDVVDDAIASRCVARIDYKYPDNNQQKQIWRILADSSNIKLSDDIINQFVEKNDDYSGRDIKNLLKLSNLRAKANKHDITVEDIEFITRFNPTIPEPDREKQND